MRPQVKREQRTPLWVRLSAGLGFSVVGFFFAALALGVARMAVQAACYAGPAASGWWLYAPASIVLAAFAWPVFSVAIRCFADAPT